MSRENAGWHGGQVLSTVILIALTVIVVRLNMSISQLHSRIAVLEGLSQVAGSIESGAIVEVSSGNGARKGSTDAPIQIIEFSDFGCPYCQASAGVMDEILAEYGDDVSLVFRHWPLSTTAQTLAPAEAAECARDQDKFWPMHDELFSLGENIYSTSYVELAEKIGLDVEEFEVCLEEQKYAEEIIKDRSDGIEAGVRGTPTYFINGQALIGAADKAVFEDVINGILDGTKE